MHTPGDIVVERTGACGIAYRCKAKLLTSSASDNKYNSNGNDSDNDNDNDSDSDNGNGNDRASCARRQTAI